MDRINEYKSFIVMLTNCDIHYINNMSDEDVIKWMKSHYPDYKIFAWHNKEE